MNLCFVYLYCWHSIWKAPMIHVEPADNNYDDAYNLRMYAFLLLIMRSYLLMNSFHIAHHERHTNPPASL